MYGGTAERLYLALFGLLQGSGGVKTAVWVKRRMLPTSLAEVCGHMP